MFEKSFAINLKSHLLATKYAVPAIIKTGGGAIIYSRSSTATGGDSKQPAYAIMKNAIHSLVRHTTRAWGNGAKKAFALTPLRLV